jgi:4-amino-4-deoxy-L-arabinose transferase-like glycosyltransferase
MTAERRLFRIALALVSAVTALRVAILVVSPLQLYPDEAQYWWWAQTPELGYFSKPPLIAWIIRATTVIFGDREWAIRLAIPLLHAATALLLFGIARAAYPADRRVALWSALAYLTTPGITYSSGLASTDPPLLFFWALALFAILRWSERPAWRWALLAGAAIGFGFLAKYAMAFFLVGLLIAAILDARIRRVLLSAQGLGCIAAAALVVAPNLVWNALHGFATIVHAGTNAHWSAAQIQPLRVVAFLAGQFGVFGPILMAAWLAGLWRAWRDPPPPHTTLAAMSVPPLLLIAAQALIAGANANWAVTGFVAATPLAVAEILRRWPRGTLAASFALHGIVLALWCAVLVEPPLAGRLGLGGAFKRQLGWQALGTRVADTASRNGFHVVAADNRSVLAELLYYARPRRFAIRMWDADLTNHNHFDMTLRLSPPAPRVLLVLSPADADQVLPTFDSVRTLATLATPVDAPHVRVMRLYDARFYRGPQFRR